jgi:polyisoprenoid-binding protein YceI
MRQLTRVLTPFAAAALASVAVAAPKTYTVDSGHTYPSFEVDHFGGVSVWRGKINSTQGTVVIDTEAKTGTVEVTMDVSAIDVGNDKLNTHMKSAEMLDVEKFPTAVYKGVLAKFKDGAPTEVQGDLTLHGVTKPVTLTIKSFKCITNPMSKKEFCGADATGKFSREDFGVSYGKNLGFKMDVLLQIQIEAKPAS